MSQSASSRVTNIEERKGLQGFMKQAEKKRERKMERKKRKSKGEGRKKERELSLTQKARELYKPATGAFSRTPSRTSRLLREIQKVSVLLR